MAKMNFDDFAEDVLGLHTGLMSSEERMQARAAYERWQEPATAATPVHPDMKLQTHVLRQRCERLVAGQKTSVARAIGSVASLRLAAESVAFGEMLLSQKRTTKADFIKHATMNSDASRALNNDRQAAK